MIPDAFTIQSTDLQKNDKSYKRYYKNFGVKPKQHWGQDKDP